MDFQTAVRTCLRKYATFTGRAARSEYWWFVLFLILAQIVLNIIDTMMFGTGTFSHGPGYARWVSNGGPLASIFALATLLPALAAAVRRLHDLDKSGWWMLFVFLPLIGGLILLYHFVQPSQPGANRFGPAPDRAPPPLP